MNSQPSPGYLLITAALLVLVVSVLVSAALYLFGNNASLLVNRNASLQALYSAESGLEYAEYQYLKRGVTCANLTTQSPLTFADSAINITATRYRPNPTASLSSSITASSSTIPITNNQNYAAQGQIIIDGEAINYFGITSSPPALLNVTRGQNGTTQAAHTVGSAVMQNQCSIIAEGAVPNFIAALGKRSIIKVFTASSRNLWTVGSGGAIFYWDGGDWISYAPKLTSSNLKSIAFAKDGSAGFIVGDKNNNNFTILKWHGNDWQTEPYPPLVTDEQIQNLTSVAVPTSKDAWAVGNTSTINKLTHFTILHWNGSSWCALDSRGSCSGITIPLDSKSGIENLTSISMLDPTKNHNQKLGFAVGGSGTILKYTNNSWQFDASPTKQNLTAVSIVSNNEAWAVGNKGMLLYWNGVGWREENSPTKKSLDCLATLANDSNGQADEIWAFGNGGHYLHYNGINWEDGHTAGGSGNGVIIISKNDAWVVGQGSNRASHWNGSTWQDHRPSNAQFYGIANIQNGASASKQAVLWSEAE